MKSTGAQRAAFGRGVGITALFLALMATVWAAPVSVDQATQAGQAWLAANASPMGAALPSTLGRVTAVKDKAGNVIAYALELVPSGYLVLSADDRIQPVMAFAATGQYEMAQGGPLTALLQADLGGRVSALDGGKGDTKAISYTAANAVEWQQLLGGSSKGAEKYLSSPSEVRVAPFIRSTWDQGSVLAGLCYNYFTPNNYICGCVATAMAQLMRYYEFPTAGIGTGSFDVVVDGVTSTLQTRGGDGTGGAYDWTDMLYDPTFATDAQRQAIGALTYDAGLSVNMDYTATFSGAYTLGAGALRTVFGYSNAIRGGNGFQPITTSLADMINPNLDAGLPVVLGILGYVGGHAILTDGYGYGRAAVSPPEYGLERFVGSVVQPALHRCGCLPLRYHLRDKLQRLHRHDG